MIWIVNRLSTILLIWDKRKRLDQQLEFQLQLKMKIIKLKSNLSNQLKHQKPHQLKHQLHQQQLEILQQFQFQMDLMLQKLQLMVTQQPMLLPHKINMLEMVLILDQLNLPHLSHPIKNQDMLNSQHQLQQLPQKILKQFQFQPELTQKEVL